MKSRLRWSGARAVLLLCLALGLLGSACRGEQTVAATATGRPLAGATTDIAEQTEPTADAQRRLTVFYTNDEHGWMEGMEAGRDAANLLGLWREAGYEKSGPYLIVSGGDMWTGPAISTWFEGESMAEVLNAMDYAASAVGNHEFDFGLEALRARAFESDFPYLSANVRNEGGQTPQEWGIEPFTVVERNGIRVGIIGLTTTLTPVTTNPSNVSAFQFLEYERALREIVPQARAEGAEMIFVAAHVCRGELQELAPRVADLNIHLMGAGHCNELFAEERAGIVLLGGGYHLTAYATATLTFDVNSDTVVDAAYETASNEATGAGDPGVQKVVEKWQARADQELDTVIGYTERGLGQHSDEMEALVTETWLLAYPTADVAITNRGGFRADLPPGEITFADVIGVLPFNNVLVDVELTGGQLLTVLAHGNAAVGGAHLGVGQWILEGSGEPIEREATYHVLVNDFMYAGGDDYTMLAEFDPHAYNTAIDWRQPLIDWIQVQESSAQNSLDPAIAALAD